MAKRTSGATPVPALGSYRCQHCQAPATADAGQVRVFHNCISRIEPCQQEHGSQ
jgi:hypothetical protein